ncbi:MAG: DUF4034 domain-containing protein [Candidatus Hydrogenedentes bacterium]|mgnify:CR=1 FL=1|nr:DUF4034 domain-containing protein [Candidatus Hydrogenedentota bacterium]
MARWMLLFAVVGTCFGAVAEGDTVRVPADQPTLPAAVEAAPPGATIELAAGKHLLPAGLRITKPLRIKGESPETTILQTTVLEGETLLADKVDGFTLEGVAIEYTGPAPPEGRTDFPSLLSVAGGRADVSNCVFRNSAGFGVFYKEGAKGSIRKSRVEDCYAIGIYVKDADTSVAVEENEVHKSGREGIVIYEKATAVVAGNRSGANGLSGIMVADTSPDTLTVRGNTCEQNHEDGIRACLRANAHIEGNTCRDNGNRGVAMDTAGTGTVVGNTCTGGQIGVDIRSPGTTVTAEGNICSETSLSGMSVFFGAKGILKGNKCLKNRALGIRVSHWETTAEVLENVCNENAGSGIVVDTGAFAAVRSNECRQNGSFGMLVSDESSSADVSENRLEGNSKGDSQKAEGLPARLQYQVLPFEIGTAFLNRQTRYLDSVATRLRKHRSRYSDGGYQLAHFYDGLLSGSDSLNKDVRPAFREALEKWAGEMPESTTPRIALAMSHVHYAWTARGHGWANEVSPEGWEGFQKHLELAEKWCVETESKPEKDPQLYATWITVAMGNCAEDSVLRGLFEKGFSLDPGYLDLYSSYCQNLLPRWGGGRKQIGQFFAEVHERTRESMGEKMYAMVADVQFCSGAVYGDSADWALVSKGFDQLLEEFPESPFYLNRYCLLACFHKDKEKAKALFDRIGDAPHLPAWEYEQAKFNRARRWARFDAPWPDLFQIEGEPPGNPDERNPTPGAILSRVMRMLVK